MYFPAFSFHEVIKLSFVAVLPVDCHYLPLWKWHQTECCHLAVLVSAVACTGMDWQWNWITAAGRFGGLKQPHSEEMSYQQWGHLAAVGTPGSQ